MQESLVKVLLIEGDAPFAQRIEKMLGEARLVQFEVFLASTLETALRQLAANPFDAVLLDLSLTDQSWLESLTRIRREAEFTPVIVVGSLDDEALAVQAVHEGAQDYLIKNEITPQLLVRSLRHAVERKRAEAAQLQAEEKYRGIFEHITEGIFQTTPDGHYLSANPALAAIYGYDSVAELMGRLTDIGDQLYVEPGRRTEFVRLMEEFDVVNAFESRVFRKDGSVIWISENVRAVRDAKGNLLYYEGTVEDITQRKQAEEKLRNSETLYHSLVETLPQNIFRKDLNEKFTFANSRFCQTLGKSLEEIIGKTDFDFFPPSFAEKYQRDDWRVMESGQTLEIVEENQPAGGEKRYVNVVKTPLYDAKGSIIGMQGIFWDITERKRAEERLQRTTAELAQSQQELKAKNEELQQDLKMAREIQQAIIPQQYPVFPRGADPKESALRFSHRYLPSGEVGGDFFNVIAISDTKAGVFICDVMGHGVRSALITAIVRTLVEELTAHAANPGQLLTQINREFRAILKQSGSIMFTTAFYAVLDLESRSLSYANAGHPKPLLIHRTTGEAGPLQNSHKTPSPALGLFDNPTYQTSESSFNPGDMLLLFTDGLYDVDGPNQDSYDQEWLLTQVRQRTALPAGTLFDELLSALKQASPGGALADDVCLVGVEAVR